MHYLKLRKQNDNFIFTKKHEGRKEVMTEGYLKEFIVKNYRINK